MDRKIKLDVNYTENGNVIWSNTKDNKLIIIDGKVSFMDIGTGAYFELYVKGTKGKGVSDADDLVYLSTKHKVVIDTLLDIMNSKTSEEIIDMVMKKYDGEFKNNPLKRTISELLRRGILISNNKFPPRYVLNKDKGLNAFKSGKFT